MKAQQFSENVAYKNRRMTTGELNIRKDRIHGKAGRRQTIAGEFEKFERPRAKSEGKGATKITSLQDKKLSEIDDESEMVTDDTDMYNETSYQVDEIHPFAPLNYQGYESKSDRVSQKKLPSFRLHSHCTIFCKRFNARADFSHTSPLKCSDCKTFANGKKLAHADKLVS